MSTRPKSKCGTVEAHDAEAAKAAAAVQFNLDEVRRNRIMVQELG